MGSLTLWPVYLWRKDHPVYIGLVRFQNRSGRGDKEKTTVTAGERTQSPKSSAVCLDDEAPGMLLGLRRV
jgi:hypothetical protein